jgi:Cdc6-like AAA superfamily ATPase
MSNPRDWFRRRRRDSLDVIPREAVDPFENGPALEIRRGRAAGDEREPALTIAAAASTGPRLVESAPPANTADASAASANAASGRATIPPPPPREGRAPLRDRVIESSSFLVRPQVVPMPASARPEAESAPEAAHAVAGGASAGAAGFAVRRRAIPLARHFAPPAEKMPFVPVSTPPATPASAHVVETPRAEHESAPARLEPAGRETLPPPARESEPAARIETTIPAHDADPPAFEPSPFFQAARAPEKPPASTFALWRDSEDEAQPDETPKFTLQAPGAGWMRGRVAGTEGGAMNAVLREAFTPTRPKQQGSLFSGRYRQLQRIIAGIEEERAHIVLYGERGSGKTSLANVVAAKAEEAGYYVLRLACSSELSFDDVFREFLRRIPATFLADGLGGAVRAGMHSFEELLPPGEVGIPDLIRAFEKLHDKHAILMIDEYDRVTNEDTKNKLAELIKNMSDASAPVTLLLIGVAEQVDELLGKHPSLRRTLVTVPLPLMTPREIDGIIAAGEEKAGLRFDPEVRSLVVDFAQGLPYHAQLLCLFAARNAVRRNSRRVEKQDLRYAVQRAVEEAEGKIKERYNLAIGVGANHGASFKDVLFAAARCASDEFGTFSVGDVAAASVTKGEGDATLALQYPLKKLTDPQRGAVLRRIATPDGLRYQYYNQMMRHYVLVRQAEERGIV